MAKRNIRGSRVLVTGASSGIGRELARELARQGAAVVVTARREDRLRQLAEELTTAGGKVVAVAGDITEPAVRQAAIDAAQSSFGGLDILVNNAGIYALGRFEVADPARIRRVMEVNFFSLVEMTRLALPLLKAGRRPMVVNVGSIVGHRGIPHCSEYSASKFAVHGFTEALRAELAQHRVDVLLVAPGTTETELFDSALERKTEPPWPTHKPISPAAVAWQIVRAMRRGSHEIIPYGWGRVMVWLNRLSPRFMDRVMARYG